MVDIQYLLQFPDLRWIMIHPSVCFYISLSVILISVLAADSVN